MKPGVVIRRCFGRYEHRITDIFRAFFFDIEQLTSIIIECCPHPASILEIGCGEGAVCTSLAGRFPHTKIVGIDPSERIGRLYSGPKGYVQFHKTREARELLPEHAGAYDMVVMCDVLHHVPRPERAGLLMTAATLCKVGGLLVVKDWLASYSFIHLLAYCSDRFLTGEQVNFETLDSLRALLSQAVHNDAIETAFLKPWRNNFVMIVRNDTEP